MPFFKGSEPAAFRRRLGLESFNFRGLLEGQAGIVETVREAMFAERVDIESDDAAIGAANFLGFEIYRERRIGAELGVIHELGEVFWRNNDRKNTVLEAVVIENIGKTRRDDAADPKVEERPGSMLARGAATEIIFRDKNFGFAIGRLVEDELGIFGSIFLVAEFGEKPAAQAGALDCFQILFWDDHVGIDIGDVERRRDTGEGCEFFHFLRSPRFTWPPEVWSFSLGLELLSNRGPPLPRDSG